MNAKSDKLKVTLPADTEILQIRESDAPRELVFRANTDPEWVAKWWGPWDVEIKVDMMDVRPGGKWRVIHRNKDGEEYAFNGEYKEVAPPEKIVNTFEFEPWAGRGSTEYTQFEDLGGERTRLTTRSLFANKADRDAMLESGMEAGAGESMDRLEELLAEQKVQTE